MQNLRDLPSVDQLLRRLKPIDGLPAEVVKNEVRAVLAEKRRLIRAGGDDEKAPLEQMVENRLRTLLTPSLRPVINATGVVLHTNLGRAPLPRFEPLFGYSNLEYDLETGRRGKRDDHTASLLLRLLDRSAVIVNNNAAAVFLVLNELANGGEVIVSRGELIEIGDSFRIPDIMARSGAILREVGTTNRTRIDDYERAITDRTRLILRVHPSNFHVTGFTARPSLEPLISLGRLRGIPVFEDLGSGCLLDLKCVGIQEPTVQQSIAAGVNLVCFSCDKLGGGPQAGIIAGDAELVSRVRRNPLYRAFRVDKLIIQALETTLAHLLKEDWQQIPALRMILTPLDEIRARAERVRAKLVGLQVALTETRSVIGGGSTPDQTLVSCVLELHVPDTAAFERRLRTGATAVITRIERNKIVVDLRTVSDQEEIALVDALLAARA